MAVAQNRIATQVNAQLVAFADCLKPSESFIKEGTQLVQRVFELLEQNQVGFSISKKYYGGSVGKSTSVVFPDFDCVVFLNIKLPPHAESVQRFENVLRANADNLQIVLSTLKTTDKTISFEFAKGVEIDLLPATNFDQHSKEVQYNAVLQRLRDARDPALYAAYSSSLAEIQIEFMRCQYGPVKQLARLAKYWFKLCTLDGNVYGGSSIMEILSMDVALDMDPVKKGQAMEILPAFRRLLQKVANIKTLKIAFYRNGENDWERVSNFNSPQYQEHFDQTVIRSRNFILEPANPYNDLARNVDDVNAAKLRSYAENMLVRLTGLETPVSNDMKEVSINGRDIQVRIHYGKLFEPFFIRLRDVYRNATNLPTHVCIDYKYQRHESAQVLAKVRDEAVGFFQSNREAKYAYKAVMNILKFLIWGKAVRGPTGGLSFTNGIPNVSNYEEVKAAVQTFVTANFAGRFVTESPADQVHQNPNNFVTLTIPYRTEGRVLAVRFSMKWTVDQSSCVIM